MAVDLTQQLLTPGLPPIELINELEDVHIAEAVDITEIPTIVPINWVMCDSCSNWRVISKAWPEEEPFTCHMLNNSLLNCNIPADDAIEWIEDEPRYNILHTLNDLYDDENIFDENELNNVDSIDD